MAVHRSDARRPRRFLAAVAALLTAAVLAPSLPARADSAQGQTQAQAAQTQSAAQSQASQVNTADMSTVHEPSYPERLAEWQKQGYKDASGVNLTVPATAFKQAGGGAAAGTDPAGGSRQVLIWPESSWVECEVDIPQTGLYHISFDYYPLPGKRASIQRDLQIDGVYNYFEARRLLFSRIWKDEGQPKRDNQGNDIRPKQVEAPAWRTQPVQDPSGISAEPLRFYLTQGKHTLRFSAIREPMALAQIRIYAPTAPPAYADVAGTYSGYKPGTGGLVRVQGEGPAAKSDPTIRGENDSDLATDPEDQGFIRLNAFGGSRWRQPGQWATWKFTVPSDGLYTVNLRAVNWYKHGIPVSRTFMIDGKVPFQELEAYTFPYSSTWKLFTLGDRAGQPYQFYLTKGEHTITAEATTGPLGQVIQTLNHVTQEMALMSRQITLITGRDPDPNKVWEVHKDIPDLLPRLTALADELDGSYKLLVQQSDNGESAEATTLQVTANQLRTMVERPETIPLRLNEFGDTQTSLGAWVLELTNQPLLVDYIDVAPAGTKVQMKQVSLLRKIWATCVNFVNSFIKNYNGVGNIYSNDKETTIDVWVARGREWAMIMKEMAEEDFTPQTGVKVNINVLPAGGALAPLVLATVSGNAPDVATGIDANLPVDFALRNAAVDLSKQPGFDQVQKRFQDGALVPFQWQGGTYALPENMDFNMLFYRKDVLNAMGLKPPQTWDEVYEMIPALHRAGMDFYYPAPGSQTSQGVTDTGFSPFLFQNGGTYYSKDGLHSGLTSEQALKGFDMWTGLYTSYKLNRNASFFNRFRTGEMPIGVANYTTYVQLSTAAPELTGWWAMAPLPGVKKADGTVDRSNSASALTAMIFKQSAKQKEAWEFLDWWTSTETQIRFGVELEALLGVEARWNTANVQALRQLPWPQSDIDAIMTQWSFLEQMPVVPGGYYTGRHVVNAWNKVVLSGTPTREALEDAVKDIDRELRKKQEEFGITPEEVAR